MTWAIVESRDLGGRPCTEHLGVPHIQPGAEKSGCQSRASRLLAQCQTLQWMSLCWPSGHLGAGAAGGPAVKDHISAWSLDHRLVTLGIRSGDMKGKVTYCCHKGFILMLEKRAGQLRTP